jgi:fructoselysine-6-P-deglycase FrlB-like protein
MWMDESWHERALLSHALLRERSSSLAAALAAQLGAPPAAPDWSELEGERIVITGAGLAEGPARYMVGLMAQVLGARVRFVPLSALGAPGAPSADALIICSQGLSPNARIAMARVADFKRALLITAAQDASSCPDERLALTAWERAGGQVIRIALEPERGLLLRVIGPAVTCLVAAQLVSAWAEQVGERAASDWPLARLPQAVREAYQRAAELQIAPEALLHGRLALVATGDYVELCHGLRWKLLEGLWREVAPVFDALQFAHGPLQSMFYDEVLVLALAREGDAHDGALLDRLERVLVAPRHRVVRLSARLPAPLSIFEHGAALDALICHAVARTTRDLGAWPGLGLDGPLYGLAGCPACGQAPCACAA